MRIRQEVNLAVLLDYGFEVINQAESEANDEWTIASYNYMYEIGHARRGQFYYLLVNSKTRIVDIYASKPDGGGTSIGLPDILITLINDNLLEKRKP